MVTKRERKEEWPVLSGSRHLLAYTLTVMVVPGSVAPVQASPPDIWSTPHPLRLEAITTGRDYQFNRESFMHRFGYRHLSSFPAAGEDGLAGTGGSVTGDELYVDISLQKTLLFDDERFGIIGRMQRREDFDGSFDRQLIGITGRINDWDFSFLADPAGNKERVALQYEANWRPDESRFLRLALIQPDSLYNDKAPNDNRYDQNPITAFLHYRQPLAGNGRVETAINYSPQAVYENNARGFSIDAEQLRVMAAMELPVTRQWSSEVRIELERSQRDFAPIGPGTVPGDNFDRRMEHVIWSLQSSDHPWLPQLGVRYLNLDESGWLGTGLAADGINTRREVGFFAGVTFRTGDNHWWEPMVHGARVDYTSEFPDNPEYYRDRDEFMAKLNLPWRVVVNREAGAVLTLNPTFRLHRPGFGGGNIQLHWPF
ncbi:MAG: hypothetical protein WDZ76_00995 [Pseudohongiellaceae bacterium]